MPRRRNNQEEIQDGLIILDENSINFEIREPIRMTKDFLKNQVWELLKEKGKEVECSVCLEEICCSKCYTLLNCGHSYHLCCIIKCKTCPLCRG